MNIQSQNFGSITSTRRTPPTDQTLEQSAEQALPKDEFIFSGGGLSAKDKLQVGTLAVAGGLLGGLPVLGALTNGISANLNGTEKDKLGLLIGLAGTLTNMAALVAVNNFGVTPMAYAVPGVLGAISWGGYAAASKG